MWPRYFCRWVYHWTAGERQGDDADPGVQNQLHAVHSMRGRGWTANPWSRVPPGFTLCLLVHRLIMLCQELGLQPQPLPLHQVCFKVGRLTSSKFRDADTTIPCIAVRGAQNPGGTEYRVVDGKHRLHKLAAAGVQSAAFYVLSVTQAAAAVVLLPTCALQREPEGDRLHSAEVDVGQWTRDNAPYCSSEGPVPHASPPTVRAPLLGRAPTAAAGELLVSA